MHPGNTLKLIPPGGRKSNPYYLVRGTFDGRRYEVSTRTCDRQAARVFKARFVLALLRHSDEWLVPTAEIPDDELRDEFERWEYLFEGSFSVDLEAQLLMEMAEAQGLPPGEELRELHRRRTRQCADEARRLMDAERV